MLLPAPESCLRSSHERLHYSGTPQGRLASAEGCTSSGHLRAVASSRLSSLSLLVPFSGSTVASAIAVDPAFRFGIATGCRYSRGRRPAMARLLRSPGCDARYLSNAAFPVTLMMRKPDQALPISTALARNNSQRADNNWAGDERLAESVVCVSPPAPSLQHAAALQRIRVHNRIQADSSDVSGEG